MGSDTAGGAAEERCEGAVRRMHKGEHLGQVEPWSPYSVRETYYPGWADGDFGTLLNQLGEAHPLKD